MSQCFFVRRLPRQETYHDTSLLARYALHIGFGIFVLVSIEKRDAFTALHLYLKDVVEKAFGNLKVRLNFRRLSVSSELSHDGKIIVEFIDLILISYLDQMKEKSCMLIIPLDKLELIECFEDKVHKLRIGEILSVQEKYTNNWMCLFQHRHVYTENPGDASQSEPTKQKNPRHL